MKAIREKREITYKGIPILRQMKMEIQNAKTYGMLQKQFSKESSNVYIQKQEIFQITSSYTLRNQEKIANLAQSQQKEGNFLKFRVEINKIEQKNTGKD